MTISKRMLVRNVVVSKDLWKKIQEKAKERGLSAAAYIRETVLQRLEKEGRGNAEN